MRSNGAIPGLIIVACCGFAGCNPVSGGPGNGTAVFAPAADSAASSYPEWAAAHPHLPSSPPLERPYQPDVIWDRNDRPHADSGGVVQIARARRLVRKRRREYLVCEERRLKNPDLK